MSAPILEPYIVPTYDAVVERNSITVLLTPGDLTLRNGDIAVTRRGDLMLNDEIYSALVRFVQFWRHNFPTLRTLFDSVVRSHEDEERATAEMDRLGSLTWEPAQGPLGNLGVTAFHALNERIDATRESRGIYAGTITLVIDRALQTLKEDLGAKEYYCAAGPQFQGRSVGEVLVASGNNFRHADEWLIAPPPYSLQMKSVNVLSDVLQEPIPDSGSIRGFARNVGAEILDVLSDRDFRRLETVVFAFVNDLAAKVRAQSA